MNLMKIRQFSGFDLMTDLNRKTFSSVWDTEEIVCFSVFCQFENKGTRRRKFKRANQQKLKIFPLLNNQLPDYGFMKVFLFNLDRFAEKVLDTLWKWWMAVAQIFSKFLFAFFPISQIFKIQFLQKISFWWKKIQKVSFDFTRFSFSRNAKEECRNQINF